MGEQRIDFRGTNERAVWFVEVKTIHPELKNRWDQYRRVVGTGRITDNVTLHFEREWMGGELWHQKFSARAYGVEAEEPLKRSISTFGYFCRPAFKLSPSPKNWSVRPPPEPW
jgi:hypothetical protein